MNARRRLTLGRALARYLRAPSPLIMLASLVCMAAARLWLGGYGWPDLAVLAGILLLWPLHEWALHVFVLHARPRRLFGYTIDLRADCGPGPRNSSRGVAAGPFC